MARSGGAALRSATEASSSGRAATQEALVTFKLRVLGLLDILARPSVAPGAHAVMRAVHLPDLMAVLVLTSTWAGRLAGLQMP